MPKRFRVTVAVVMAAMALHATAAAPGPTEDEIAALIKQLGDADYGRRELATAQLDALGPAAVDPLLAAAEMSDDLEVAMRARWLVESIPLSDPADPPAVVKLLDRYKTGGFAARVTVMHRLLRIEDDAGIGPLARIVRLDRDPTLARVATALLVREWSPDDPYWPAISQRITAGLGASRRPAAQFLRSVVDFSQAITDADRDRSLATARTALAILGRATPTAPADDPLDEDVFADTPEVTADIGTISQLIFDRCLARMLIAADRRDEAASIVRAAIDASLQSADEGTEKAATVATLLVWAADNGLPEVVDAMAGVDVEAIRDATLVRYASAVCERARQREADASRLANAAFEHVGGDPSERLQAAISLVKWGAGDWASREYDRVIADPALPITQLAVATIMYSEFLHSEDRNGEAADSLRTLVNDQRKDRGNQPILQQIGRDPLSIRSRMHFFESCAAAARGDVAAQRKALEESLRTLSKDVDALIALYRLPDNSPEQKAVAVKRINEALTRIEGEIEAVPNDSNGFNEYAWLVANTEGDVAKATRYSRRSLADSFDNSSYLDTLAHCHAAAGNFAAAIRTQRLALRQEPHNRTIRLNLQAFERRAAAATTP